MKRRLPFAGSQASVSYASNSDHPVSNQTTTTAVAKSETACSPPSKRLLQGSRLVIALKSLANNISGNPVSEEPRLAIILPQGHKSKSVLAQSLVKMSSTLFKTPGEPTVICRTKPKGRPPLPSLETLVIRPFFRDSASSSTPTTPSTNHSGKSSGPTNDSTGKTSLDSKFSPSKDQHSSDRKWPQRSPGTKSSDEAKLTPIQETAMDQANPTVSTVERAAAAKIYLETYFNGNLCRPSARSIRLRYLEAQLYNSPGLTEPEKSQFRHSFYRRESDHLREYRVLKSRSGGALVATQQAVRPLSSAYEVVKVLGKGSFGVVRLVREKTADGEEVGCRKQVYAMKVIRKSDMIRTSQEGHLRAERDFLVASEGSKWVVPLMSSFQDLTNLYLVMEYMPGGDFLGLLIRENVLHETVARFYVAEMILCVEAAHALKFIHRDIKPDNFLISSSGHLKISDFGLAFDGHWSHDTAYYNCHRYSLLGRLHISVEGDEHDKVDNKSLTATIKWASGIMQGIEKHEKANPADGEPLLNWRNRCGQRTSAMSVVGTSQYMAPEVIEGRKYDGRCDWWSIGVILYECLYGHTPFLSEEGRQQTKKNISNYRNTFSFPSRPAVSHRCQHLVVSLIQDKEHRLCSKRYQFKDLARQSSSSGTPSTGRFAQQGTVSATGGGKRAARDMAGRYVFPYDAEDIKAHKWFRGVPWEHLHQLTPPFVPQIRAEDDTHYFDEEEPISDWGDSIESSDDDEEVPLHGLEVASHNDVAHEVGAARVDAAAGPLANMPHMKPAKQEEMLQVMDGLRASVQDFALRSVATPYDTLRLRNIDAEIEGYPDLTAAEREFLGQFVRVYGRKERKRPRDRLLRDRNTRAVVMDVRKRTAFLGYTWRRMRAPLEAAFGEMRWDDVAVLKALHRGRSGGGSGRTGVKWSGDEAG